MEPTFYRSSIALHWAGVLGARTYGDTGFEKGIGVGVCFCALLLSTTLDIDIDFHTALLRLHVSEMRWHVHTYTKGGTVWRLHGEGFDGSGVFMESARPILFFWGLR
jgi:hypothetical protein